MNKEKLLELSDTLRGIAEGTHVASFEQWHEDGWIKCKFSYRHEPQPPPPDPYAEIKEAYAAGKTIQYSATGELWIDCDEFGPHFYKNLEYRIKPEPRKVPLEPDDVPPLSVMRPSGWIKGFVNFEAVVLNGIRMIGDEWGYDCSVGYVSWQQLMDDEWQILRPTDIDWQPFHKIIEE